MAGSSQLFQQAEQLQKNLNRQINQRGQARRAQRGRLEQRFDVGGRRQTIEDIRRRSADVERRLEGLPQQLQGRTAGRRVTQAQLDRLTSAEQDPLLQALRGTTRQLGTEQQGLSDVENQIAQRLGEGEDLFRLRLQQGQTNLQNLLNRAQAERSLEAQRRAAAQAAALQQQLIDSQIAASQPTGTTEAAVGPSDFARGFSSLTRTLDPSVPSQLSQIAQARNPNLSPAALSQIEQIALANQRLQRGVQQSAQTPFGTNNSLSNALNNALNPQGGQIGGIGGFLRGLFG